MSLLTELKLFGSLFYKDAAPTELFPVVPGGLPFKRFLQSNVMDCAGRAKRRRRFSLPERGRTRQTAVAVQSGVAASLCHRSPRRVGLVLADRERYGVCI